MSAAMELLPEPRAAMTFLWFWLAVVLVHGLWRSRAAGGPEPIRPSGPLE